MEDKNGIGAQENSITTFDDDLKPDGSNLICIAARPGMGKTALALHVALEYAMTCDKAVYIFSCEMSAAQIRSRMICYLADVDTYSIREGLLTEKQAERIAEAEEKLRQRNIVVDDKDKRKQRVILTQYCKEFCETNDKTAEVSMQKMFAGVNEEQLKVTIQTIMQIEDNLKEL